MPVPPPAGALGKGIPFCGLALRSAGTRRGGPGSDRTLQWPGLPLPLVPDLNRQREMEFGRAAGVLKQASGSGGSDQGSQPPPAQYDRP